MDPYPRTWVEVDLPALAHNLSEIREVLGDPSIRIALVAKADAYGHGLVPVARYALRNGADWVAVATVPEGISLRDAGVEAPILVISPTLAVEAEQAVFYHLDVLIESAEIAQVYSKAALTNGTEARLHLEVDTGLGRFGCRPQEAPQVAKAIAELPGVKLMGVAQHFVDSSKNPPFTRYQIGLFKEVLKGLDELGVKPELVHAANSAGATKYPESRFDMVRVGLLAYGMDPNRLMKGRVKPVLRWAARVTALRELPEGVPLGYNGTFVTVRPTRIATVGVGYGDGYPRNMSNKGIVDFGGRDAPVVGMVCMDQTLVDVTDLPDVGLGDEALLIGGSVKVERVAKLGNTNTHEIVTRIMSRVPRRYKY